MPGRPSANFQFWNHFDDHARRASDEKARLDLIDAMTPTERRPTRMLVRRGRYSDHGDPKFGGGVRR